MPVLDSNSESQAVYIEQVRQFRAGGKQPRWRYAANRDERLKAKEIDRAVSRLAFGYTSTPAREAAVAAVAERPAHLTCDRCGKRIRGRVLPYRSVYERTGRVDCYRCPACTGRA